MRTRTVLSRPWLQVQEALKVKFRHTAQQDHRRIQQEVIQHNILHSCAHLHRFLHRCVQSMNFSDHSRSVLFFFHRLSSPSWSLCFSLRIPCFFLHILYRTRVCMFYSALEFVFYSALEFVYYIAHLSLCIIAYLFYKYHTHTHKHILLRCECGVSVLDSVRMRARACICTENPGISV